LPNGPKKYLELPCSTYQLEGYEKSFPHQSLSLGLISLRSSISALSCPVGVEELPARLIDALVGMCAEMVVLS